MNSWDANMTQSTPQPVLPPVPPPRLMPGHIMAVRTNNGLFSRAIRFAAALRDEPNLDNHIAVMHHYDAKGTPWCIEARPGGVGWRDAREYLSNRYTITNIRQNFTTGQGLAIATAMQAMLYTDYDWAAIADDALKSFGINIPGWDMNWKMSNGQLVVPAHVDCSALADYAYLKNHVACPTGGRTVTPDDWVDWLIKRGWEGYL